MAKSTARTSNEACGIENMHMSPHRRGLHSPGCASVVVCVWHGCEHGMHYMAANLLPLEEANATSVHHATVHAFGGSKEGEGCFTDLWGPLKPICHHVRQNHRQSNLVR